MGLVAGITVDVDVAGVTVDVDVTSHLVDNVHVVHRDNGPGPSGTSESRDTGTGHVQLQAQRYI